MEAISLLTPVVQYLGQLVNEKARLVGEVKEEVTSLQRTLDFISKYLETSKGKEHPISKVEIDQIMEKAYEAEDVIDTFILTTSKHTRRNKVGKMFHLYGNKSKLLDVANSIQRLNKEISKIFADSTKYRERAEASVNAETEDALHQRRREVEEALHRRRREVEEDGVVGFNNNLIALAKLFIANGSELDVISIVGMGGLGKTTLARKFYKDSHVMSFFSRRAWVYVSQHDKTTELLLKILKEMPISDELRTNLKVMGDGELKETLSKCLNGERYLVVMDDIWKTNFWDEVRSVFPNNSNGSRILITSRDKAVVKGSSLTPPYDLPFLNEGESLELFYKKVFRGDKCPPELEPLAQQLVAGCHGLPLSIVVLGGILACENHTIRAWSPFSPVNCYLIEQCKDILALSYTHLSQHLKPCFLYLGAYPKDFEIPVKQLIDLWIAEGFINHTHGKDLKDAAEDYLKELIDRSLIQVASWRTNEKVKTCRIHDLLRDLCMLQGAEEKFLKVLTQVDNFSANKCRRLSIEGSIDPYISSNPSHLTLPRSLLLLGQYTNDFDQNHWTWVENLKLVRVLNVGHVINFSIPKSIGSLFLLRYLAIKSDALTAIPTSICELANLETLDMRGTSLNHLPKGIWKLLRLRNLYMSGPVSFPKNLDPNVKVLWSLQVLSTVSLTPQNVRLIVDANPPNIKKLGIWFADESNSEVVDVMNSLICLRHLEKLKLINCSEHPGVPISFPSTITKITLRQVSIEVGGSMKVLGKLPDLLILKLQNCMLSSDLEFNADSFPKLEVLKLEDLRIKEWKQEIGAMRYLKHLVIKRCIELTVLPSESLCSLQDVELLWSNIESITTLQELRKKKSQENLRNGFNLLINPPPGDNFYRRTSASAATSS